MLTDLNIKEKLKDNTNIFLYQTSNSDGNKNVVIDYSSILSFYVDTNYDELSLIIKMTNNAKATYIFEESDTLERFFSGYNKYITNRNSLDSVSKDMLSQIVTILKDEISTSTKEMIQESISEVKNALTQELSSFKDAVKDESDKIVNTALSHQKNINVQNEELLQTISEMVKRSNASSKVFDTFSDRIEKLVSSLDLIAPVNENELKEVDLNTSSLNKETENA